MLDHAQINLGLMLFYLGLAAGVSMVIAGDVTGEELVSHLGLIVTIMTCAHGIRRAVVVRDEVIRCAFETGRMHERETRTPALH